MAVSEVDRGVKVKTTLGSALPSAAAVELTGMLTMTLSEMYSTWRPSQLVTRGFVVVLVLRFNHFAVPEFAAEVV